MIIQIDEKGTKDFYKEVISVSCMYSKLIKHPTRKYIDIFKYYARLFILCIVLGILCFVLSFYSFDSYTMYMAIAAVMLFCSLVSFIYLLFLRKSLKTFMQDDSLSVLSLDEEGIQLEKSGNMYRIAWKNVALTRSFKNSLCIIGNEYSKMIISVATKYEDKVLKYITDNGIECNRVEMN